jgi:excisionase family DNA binding protein
MTERELARMLKVSPRTLRAWRVEGTGPRWLKIGRGVRYRRRDVEQWLAEQGEGPGTDPGPGR